MASFKKRSCAAVQTSPAEQPALTEDSFSGTESSGRGDSGRGMNKSAKNRLSARKQEKPVTSSSRVSCS